MEKITGVSCGFYFENGSVCLIRKTHPTTHAGMLCGVGGKLEQGESPAEAMVREFREETGVVTDETLWTLFCITRVYVNNDKDIVPCVIYRFVNNQPAYKFDPLTQTDEEVGMYPLAGMRVLIDRTKYLDKQIPHTANRDNLIHYRAALLNLEDRAAERHGRTLPITLWVMDEIETLPTCPRCLHVLPETHKECQ